MKILVHNRSIVKAGFNPYHRQYKRIYSAEETKSDADYDNEFDDIGDISLPDDVDEAFDMLVDMLRKQSFEDLGDALEDIVNDDKLYALLSEGFGDGELANVKMSSESTGIPVVQLLPSQSEIGLDNSLNYPLSMDCTNYFNDIVKIVAPVITYRKTFIIDGHHRWSQLYMINPKAKIAAINFNYDQVSPYRALRNFQGAVAVANKNVPKSFNKVNNVYDMSDSAIEQYVDEHITDACWKSLVKVGVCEDRDSAIDYILDNIDTLKYDNPPFANAPEREFMPQTDEKSIKIAEEGQTNI